VPVIALQVTPKKPHEPVLTTRAYLCYVRYELSWNVDRSPVETCS